MSKSRNKDRTSRLLELMDQQNWSPAEVAAMVARSEQTVYHWRVGNKNTIPELILEKLERIAAGKD